MKVRTAEVDGKTMYVLGDVMKVAGKGTSSNMKKIMKNKENVATFVANSRPLNVVSVEGIEEIAKRYGIEGLLEKVLELAGETVHSKAPEEKKKDSGPEEIEILKARAEYNESEARRLEAQTLNMKQRLEYAEAIFRTADRMPYGKRKHILENEGINALAGRSAVDCWDMPSEKTYAPSVIGGMLVEKLRGFDRICVNPALHMGQTMGTSIKFGEYPIATPREDGVTKINVTKALAKEFDEVCALNFEGLDSEDAARVVGLFGTRDPFVNCFAEFSEHYPSSAYFEGEHRLTDDVLLHSVMPIVRRFWERQAALDSPAVFIDYATLHDDYGKQRSSARLAFETLSQRYNVYCVAPQDAQPQQWLQENIGVPAWNHLFLTNHRERLYGDYLITLYARDEDTFLGTTLLFGSPQFKTWDALLEYFDQLGGQ